MRTSIVTLGQLIPLCLFSLFLLGCWEGEKATPLKRTDSNKSTAASEKPVNPPQAKAKQTDLEKQKQ